MAALGATNVVAGMVVSESFGEASRKMRNLAGMKDPATTLRRWIRNLDENAQRRTVKPQSSWNSVDWINLITELIRDRALHIGCATDSRARIVGDSQTQTASGMVRWTRFWTK